AAFAHHGVRHPQSVLVATDGDAALPAWIDEAGAWIKRGDVHATEPDDVVRVADRTAAGAALAAFARRGITTACVQRHVAGAVVKFYAVRGGAYFAPFPPDGTVLDAPLTAALATLAEAGAAALDLEVFGGDCIVEHDRS